MLVVGLLKKTIFKPYSVCASSITSFPTLFSIYLSSKFFFSSSSQNMIVGFCVVLYFLTSALWSFCSTKVTIPYHLDICHKAYKIIAIFAVHSWYLNLISSVFWKYFWVLVSKSVKRYHLLFKIFQWLSTFCQDVGWLLNFAIIFINYEKCFLLWISVSSVCTE